MLSTVGHVAWTPLAGPCLHEGTMSPNHRLMETLSTWLMPLTASASAEEPHMKYGVIHQFEGGTEAQYKAMIAAVHPAGGGLPAGQLTHVAGPTANIGGSGRAGWTIAVTHESQESWDAFRESVIVPAMEAGVEGGFTSAPEETAFEIHSEG